MTSMPSRLLAWALYTDVDQSLTADSTFVSESPP